MRTPSGQITLKLKLPGRHNVMNALAAAAAAHALGVKNEKIRKGLEAMQAVKGRLQFREGVSGMQVLDDTYNANPSSLQAALDVLSSLPGRKWLVLGDMAELGEDSEGLHRQAGLQARESGVERLYLTGRNSEFAAQGFGAGACFIEDKTRLVDSIYADWITEGATQGAVLVKGSRSMQMEKVVDLLVAKNEERGNEYKSSDQVKKGGR